MTFVLEQIVNEIHVEYSALTDTNICAEFGNLEKAKHADSPRIVWTLTGGTFGASTKIGTNDAALAQALPSFWVWLWFDDLQQCWEAMANLIAAIRRTVYGPNMGIVKFDCPTEIEGRHMEKGEVIVLTVQLSVPLRVDGTKVAEMFEFTAHESTVTMESGLEEPPADDHAIFETVLVTGPLP